MNAEEKVQAILETAYLAMEQSRSIYPEDQPQVLGEAIQDIILICNDVLGEYTEEQLLALGYTYVRPWVKDNTAWFRNANGRWEVWERTGDTLKCIHLSYSTNDNP